jgi:hypothetical protein
VSVDECLRWSPFATAAGNPRQTQIARDAGALGQVLPHLLALGNAAARGGDFAGTASHMAEPNAIGEATDTRLLPYSEMLVLAMRGREAETVTLTPPREASECELVDHARAREAVDRLAVGALGSSPSLASAFLSGAAPSTADGFQPPRAVHPREA